MGNYFGIDISNNNRCDNCNGNPGRIDIKARNRVHIPLKEIRENISDDRRHGACLKRCNRCIAEDNRPCADKGCIRSHRTITEYMLAAALWHS